MSVYRKWASAETSSNLKHEEWDCQVDVLGAIGMAGIKESYAAVFRLKYLSDAGSYRVAREQFKVWTIKAYRRRRMHAPLSVNVMADDIMKHWLADVCSSCGGHEVDEGATGCDDCKGTGRQVVKGEKVFVMITLDVLEMVDRVMGSVGAQVSRKMGKKKY